MKKPLAALALPLALVAPLPASAAGFEGVVDMKISAALSGETLSPSGTSKTWISPAGARVEMTMDMSGVYAQMGKDDPDAAPPPKGRKTTMTILWKASAPGKTYMVNEKTKSYSVLDVSAAQDSRKPEKEWAVKRLGNDRVGGFACTNYAITSDDGQSMELCVSPDLKASSGWWEAMRARERSRGGMAAAMKKVVEEGFPVRQLLKDKAGKTTMVTEVVAVNRQSVPASTFEIPAGFKESSMGAAGAMMSPEQQKAMEEQMKKLTPEQRRQIEQMMKGQQKN